VPPNSTHYAADDNWLAEFEKLALLESQKYISSKNQKIALEKPARIE